MFTGLIEEIGTIKSTVPLGAGLKLSVSCSRIMAGVQLGDSININGACQTVDKIEKDCFEVTAIEETLKKTTLGEMKRGQKVNLESSLSLNKKLGGHFVLGHVDTTGRISSIKKLTASYIMQISYPSEFEKFIIHVGAIAVDGISLTISDFNEQNFSISIIPHTWQQTTLHKRMSGDLVNLEFDVLGKYVAKILNREKQSGITENWLKELGF